jgi:hypothetical protein
MTSPVHRLLAVPRVPPSDVSRNRISAALLRISPEKPSGLPAPPPCHLFARESAENPRPTNPLTHPEEFQIPIRILPAVVLFLSTPRPTSLRPLL